MKKAITVRWICTVILIILAVTGISTGKIAGPLLLIIAAALAIPLKATQKLKSKLKLNSIISIILSVVLFYSGLFLTVSPSLSEAQEENTTHSNYYSSLQTTEKSTQVSYSYNENSSTTLSQSPSETSTAPSSSHESLSSANGSAPNGNSYIPNGNISGSGSQNSTAGSSSIPEYSGSPYAVINNNTPVFSSAELTTVGYESYSALDSLGRVGVAVASLGKETMPKEGEERGSISHIYPTGWKQEKYDSVSGKYLYNRSHLIGWQLSAENANRQNLMTGTKYFNTKGMLPFENMVADYIKETSNHVAYRVTPVFKGGNLLASGVQIEAYSVEDGGDGICFNVFCYNVQPGIKINYSDGSSSHSGTASEATTKKQQSTTASNKQNTTKPSTTKQSTAKPSTTAKPPQTTAPKTTAPKSENSKTVYITKTGTKYHSRKDCSGLSNANEIYDSTLQTAQKNGYTPCKKCH